MMKSLSEKTVAALNAAREGAFAEGKGFVIPEHQAERCADAVDAFAEGIKDAGLGISHRTGKVDENKVRMLAKVCEQQVMKAILPAIREGRVEKTFGTFAEGTTSSDFATFTRDTLAWVGPIFERIVLPELVTLMTMQGPTAKVHTLDFRHDTNDGYSVGQSFQGRLDMNYFDAPSECAAANELDMAVSSVDVTAVAKAFGAKISTKAIRDYAAQYGGDARAALKAMGQLELAREIQKEAIYDIASGAGNSGTWSSTITAGSVYLTLDPKVYARTLYDAINDLNNEIFKDNYRGGDWIVGTPDQMVRLKKLEQFTFEMGDRTARDMAGQGSVKELGGYEGRANSDFDCWKMPFVPSNKLILGSKGTGPESLYYVHGVYVPVTMLNDLEKPIERCIEMGGETEYVNKMVRANGFGVLTIT
jgi:hypothetical protein